MASDLQRRRLTVSRCDPAVASIRAGGGEDSQAALAAKAGLSELFSTTKGRVVSITSVTDADLKRRQSFSPKDEAILMPDGSDEGELLAWVKSLGIGWACRKGLKPESPNQDSFSLLVVENEFALYCVYDGHGPAGHDISDISRETLVKLFLRHPARSSDPGKAFTDAFVECQRTLEDMKEVDPSMSGTTCTMAYHDFVRDRLVVAHVGDSRAVLGWRSSDGATPPEVEDLTVDHKPNLEKERQRIESATPPGRVVFDGFYNHRVFAQNGMYPGLNMSRALGDVIGHKEAGLTAVPDVKEIDLSARRASGGTVLLLCTDGVWEFIQSKEAMALVSEFDKAHSAEAMKKLAEESWDRWMKDSDHEISDDITGILVHLS